MPAAWNQTPELKYMSNLEVIKRNIRRPLHFFGVKVGSLQKSQLLLASISVVIFIVCTSNVSLEFLQYAD